MSVELDPVELGFRRPFTQEVEEKLKLKNPNSEPVAFKVKTTAPRQYCVRPNSGRIEAGQQVEVSVLLQAMKEDPPLDAKCRDKFLVQSVGISASDENTTVASIWSNIEQTGRKSSITEKKIRVSFLPSDGSVATPARQTSTSLNHEDEPPAYSSPVSTTATPQQAAVVGGFSKADSKTASGFDTGDAVNSATTGSAVAAAARSVPAEAKAKASEAQAAVASGVKTVQEQGLRQRTTNRDTTTGSAAALGVQQAPPAGVPVPIVAALCLLSFLLAYLFF